MEEKQLVAQTMEERASSPPPGVLPIDSMASNSPTGSSSSSPNSEKLVDDDVTRKRRSQDTTKEVSRPQAPLQQVCTDLESTHLTTLKRARHGSPTDAAAREDAEWQVVERASQSSTDQSSSTSSPVLVEKSVVGGATNDDDDDGNGGEATKADHDDDDDDASKDDIMSWASAETYNLDSSDNESMGEEEEEEVKKNKQHHVSLTRPFDMDLLKRSIELGSTALDQVTGKHVVLVVGKTGTGKSSLIQGLAGKTFSTTTHVTHYNGNTAHKKVYEVVDDCPIPGFDVGHDKTSKTKAIACLEQETLIHVGGGEIKRKSILYLDSPGFEDTNGHEIDVATSVMFHQVAKACKSLRFCILIHYASLLEDRGGAIRSILKFTRRFVKDFDQERQSFVFLFTHTNEIMFDNKNDDDAQQASYTLENARAFLEEEIVRTLKETKDDDVKVVLEYMRKCLKKRVPLVDVLHPLETDYEALRKTLETKVKTVKNPTLSVNCGLTPASGYKLEGEVQNMKLQLRHYLKDHTAPNVWCWEVNRIRETLRYLGKYIDMTKIQEAVTSCEDTVSRYCILLLDLVDQEIRRGTDLVEPFGPKNAQNLKDTVQQLLELDSSQTKEKFSLRLQREVHAHYNDLLLTTQAPSCDDFRSVAMQLDKLCTWKEVFASEFHQLFENVKAHFACVISNHTGKVQELVPKAMENTVVDREKDIFFENLKALDSIAAVAVALASHGLPANEAMEVFASAKKQMAATVSSWREEENSMMEVDKVDESTLQSYAFKIKCLDDFRSRFERSSICTDLCELMQTTSLELEARIVQQLKDTAAELERLLLPFNDDAFQKLKIIQEATVVFRGVRGSSWKEIEFSYLSIVSTIRSLLSVKSKDLDTRVDGLEQHGIRDGKTEGESMQSFYAYVRLDMFFDPADRFVENCAIRYQKAHDDRIDSVLKNLNELFGRLHEASTDRLEVLSNFEIPFKEAFEISEYLLATGAHERRSEAEAVVTKQVQQYIESLETRKESSLSEWKLAVEARTETKELKRTTRAVDTLLSELKSLLQKVPIVTSQASGLLSEVRRALSDFKEEAKTMVSADSVDYGELARMLHCVRACGSSPQTADYLPSFLTLKQSVSSIVSKHAKRVEDMVEKSAEWDAIDEELAALKDATKVDAFIGGEAGSRLGPLLKLREKKESDVDNLLEELIVKEDFNGIGKFLSPFAESHDQVKRQKFDRHQRKICSSLKGLIECCQQQLRNNVPHEEARKIEESISKLENAQTEIGRHLKVHLNLASHITGLKKTIDDEVSDLLDSISKAIKEDDFVGIGTSQIRLVIFQECLGKCVYKNTQKKLRQGLSKYTSSINRVPALVNRFVKSNFADGVEITTVLGSLKRCSDHPALHELTALYDDTTAGLVKNMNARLKHIDSFVCETQCYGDGIGILQALHRQQERGLKNHVDDDAYVFNCQQKLEAYRTHQKNHDKEMDIGGPDSRQKLRMWSKKLNSLRSPRLLQKAKNIFWDAPMYETERQKLEKRVQGVFADAKAALQNRDFNFLQVCIEVLDAVVEFVSEHMKGAGKEVKELKERTTRAFLDIADKMKRALQEEMLNQFESYFDDYQGFFVDVPHVRDELRASKEFSLVNQLVSEVLEKQINEVAKLTSLETGTFEFTIIRSAVEQARKFGGFVADNFVLLQEKLQTEGNSEKWLGKISKLCHEHFRDGRDLKLLKFCALIGVVPSASVEEVKRAFRRKAREVHPDKKKTGNEDKEEDIGAEFRKVKEAQDILLEAAEKRNHLGRQPFDELLRGVGALLRVKVQNCLSEQRYASIKSILFNLSSLTQLDSLVSQKLKSDKTCEEVIELIRNHVAKVKIEVESNWSARKYSQLNDNITDLKLMEQHWKSFANVFPSTWDSDVGILGTVEDRIDCLGKKARDHLSDKKTAKKQEDEFRRCFIEMGSVMVELPAFKDYTKRVMCDVLETCLRSEWGYSYLFELGLSLQRGEGDQTEEEARIAHMMLSEFSHFKEVMTMAWNTETTQKPVEDTVACVKGQDLLSCTELPLDQKSLLESYETFESVYKTLLGEYIRPNADLDELVEKTKEATKTIMPITCDGGWNLEVKRKLPHILAGVFALFTVVKSGESYNRMEESEEAARLGDKILMKPHNIQVLTLLHMFGCGDLSCDDLESQLLQIRTGEGKSMILGAGCAVLGLLGYKVRCVCYSDYLSTRDYGHFEEVFKAFGLCDVVKYSKITALSEATTAAKGDIRTMTESLLLGGCDRQPAEAAAKKLEYASGRATRSLGERATSRDSADGRCEPISGTQRPLRQKGQSIARRTRSSGGRSSIAKTNDPSGVSPRTEQQQLRREEILLVDEVDVFFGQNFYGQTYNQVAQIREPEVSEMLKSIWAAYKKGGRRQRLADIKKLSSYKRLIRKVPGFEYVVDNEISLMLDQVKRVEDEPYYLVNDQIGYKVMDSVSFNVTYGYRTVFAYLKESDRGALVENDSTLERVLCMNISCGQFSYANIQPARILGVSGTLEAMGDYERRVLSKYGIGKFLFMPSVYGQSNFDFQKAGDGIFIEGGKSDFFHTLMSEIRKVTKQKRAVIVFFQDTESMKEFEESAFYRKLGRQKAKLSENMDSDEKDFVIKKAATAGQLTICPAVFGRGTDFFCKDQRVLDGGGVHIIQTFLSKEKSEEIQIQGRTARQGKKGTYQLILLDSDLQEFGINTAFRQKIPKNEWYDSLSCARDKKYGEHCEEIEHSLAEATARDESTHKYFDALLDANAAKASKMFKDIYLTMKKRSMPSHLDIDLALLVDTTGSMGPYIGSAKRTIESIISGPASIVSRLTSNFPEIQFRFRVAVMAYRDIDDQNGQFQESTWKNGQHFTNNSSKAVRFLQAATANPSGGFDLAEDHLGAIDRCTSWNDWEPSSIKFIMLFTDAPAHAMAPAAGSTPNVDNYATRHPGGLTPDNIVGGLLSKEIELVFCSFNPLATAPTETQLSCSYLNHPDNPEAREITCIPMVPQNKCQTESAGLLGGYGQHIVFVLDQSGSMAHNWAGVEAAYRNYIDRRMQNQSQSDLISVVQFDGASSVTVRNAPIASAPRSLSFSGGGTYYSPAADDAKQVALSTPSSHAPVVVFMSDGATHNQDAAYAAQVFAQLNHEIRRKRGHDLELHVIAFGAGMDTSQLAQIAQSSPKGQIHTSATTAELSNIFVEIAQSSQDVGKVLEAEVGRRISDAVSDKLSMEYLG